MIWQRSHRFDARALPLADRHYSRRKPGSPQFVQPGRCLVLLTPEADALWVTSWPFARYVRHAWADAWTCSLFRNESCRLSSDLIRDAVAATRAIFGEPPELGMVTFVDPSHIPGYFRRDSAGRVLEWGYSYREAGFRHVGWTKGGLYAMQMMPAAMPRAHLPSLPLFAEVA